MLLSELRIQLMLCSVWLAAAAKIYHGNNSTLNRNRRQLPLIFEKPAAITFITGFGIPVNDLDPELVTVGMVLKAQQFLPTTYAALRQQAHHSINKRQANLEQHKENERTDHYRFEFYKALEKLSITLGQAGHECVLKMICEAAATPFSYKNGVLGEIMHILLTPSTTFDSSLAYHKPVDFDYLLAERNGHNTTTCDIHYAACYETILERITNIFE